MSKKKIYIRVDMNQVIATGHVMRCLSIADELTQSGLESVFVLADEKATEIIQNRGYKYIVLNTIWDDMDSEIEKIIELIQKEKIEKLLIDTYQVTENYLNAIYDLTETIYIDDINMFTYPVHKLVCYASYWQKFDYDKCYQNAITKGTICKKPILYMGCSYVPLRQEFREVHHKIIRRDINDLLIMSGGTDKYHAIKQILNELDINRYACINVICGRYNKDYDELIEYAETNTGVHVYNAVDNIIDFMRNADVAISAGGTTLYELCAVGTPTIMYSIADNQLDNVMQFDQDKLMTYVGDYREGNKLGVENVLRSYTYDLRKEKSSRMKKMMGTRGRWNEIVSY